MIIPIKPWLDLASGNQFPMAGGRVVSSASALALSSNMELDPCEGGSRRMIVMPAILRGDKRMEFYHESILAQEILESMQPVAGKQIFDGTLGGGGHADLLLRNGAHVIGCDQDEDALSYATERLAQYGDSFLPVKGNFRNVDSILAGQGIGEVDGILLDLGISSRQIDNPERGFSFRGDGPLDMRMDAESGLTAEDVVNEWEEGELIRIFRQYGEEPRAARVAREIVKVRESCRITTTLGLAEVVGRVIPKTSAKNPATKIFQAIRIAVNGELDALEEVLGKSASLISKGGVLAIITFHSLEDRIVKQFMHRHSAALVDRPEWAAPRANPECYFHLPSRKAITPGEVELQGNSRSRSAKLRVAVRI